MQFVNIFAVQNILQITTVLVFVGLNNSFHILTGDPAVCISDIFQTGNFAVLMGFHGFDEVGGIHQAFVGTGVQPGEALTQQLYVELAGLQIDPVQVGDLQFVALGGLQALGVLHNTVVIEI